MVNSNIVYQRGDLLQSDCNVIIHGCNCFNTMGAGIAAQIRKFYPEAYKADLATVKGDRNKLGSFTYAVAKNSEIPRIIINLYSQYNYGIVNGKAPIDYLALEKGSIAIKLFLKNMSEPLMGKLNPKIGLPRIGAGLAGGNWNTISNILNKVWTSGDNQNTPIWIYSL